MSLVPVEVLVLERATGAGALRQKSFVAVLKRVVFEGDET